MTYTQELEKALTVMEKFMSKEADAPVTQDELSAMDLIIGAARLYLDELT